MTSSALAMSVGIAATEPTIGGDARMGVIGTHGADIGFGRIRKFLKTDFRPRLARTVEHEPCRPLLHLDFGGQLRGGTFTVPASVMQQSYRRRFTMPPTD